MSESFLLRGLILSGVWILESNLLLLVAWLITLLCRKSAALRHLTWLLAFAVLFLLPVVHVMLPVHLTIRLPLPAARQAAQTQSIAPPNAVTAADRLLLPLARARIVSTLKPGEENEIVRAASSRDIGTLGMLGLLTLWLSGVVAVMVQGVLALYGIGRMRRRSVPGDFPSLDLPCLVSRVGLKRRWELRVSVTPVPLAAMTWGCVRPVVLLPQDVGCWPGERLEAVLLHELAHVRRCDSLSQLLSLCVCALYWFHPAVWLSARAMRAAAEGAADDAVLRAGIKPSAYARELLRFAAQPGLQKQSLVGIGVSIMKHSKIEARIQSIVDPSNPRRQVTPLEGLKAAGLGMVTLLALGSLRPSVSFAQERQDVPGATRVSAMPPTIPQEVRSSQPGARPMNAQGVTDSKDIAATKRQPDPMNQNSQPGSTIRLRGLRSQRRRNAVRDSHSDRFPQADTEGNETIQSRQRAFALEDMRQGKGNASGKGKALEAEARRQQSAILRTTQNAEEAAYRMAEADAAAAYRLKSNLEGKSGIGDIARAAETANQMKRLVDRAKARADEDKANIDRSILSQGEADVP